MPAHLKTLSLFFFLSFGLLNISSGQAPAQLVAFQKLTRLELAATIEILNNFQRINPDKPLSEFLLNYAEFLEVFVSGDEELWEQYKTNASRRLKRISSFEKDEYYYYAIWNLHLQNAILRIRFGDNIRAGISMYGFYRALEEGVTLQPQNNLNLQGRAVFDIFFGMVPQDFLWLFRLAGIKGDYERGIRFLDAYAERVKRIPGFAEEARFIRLAVALQLENKPYKVIQLIEERNDFKTIDSPSRFLYALALLNTGQSAKVIDVLNQYRPLYPEYEIVFMRLLLGEAMLYRGEKRAGRHFEYFLQNYQGSDYRKVAWHKLALFYLMEENGDNFQYCLRNLQTDGSLLTDPDRQAFAELNYLADYHPALLKSRLRFDGGLYTEALAELSGFTPRGRRQQIEYLYRLGRIHHKMGNILNANVYYHKVMEADWGSGYYFSANSALMLAQIYLENNENTKAEEYYRLALRLNQGEYKRSIDFRAKRGLKQLSDL